MVTRLLSSACAERWAFQAHLEEEEEQEEQEEEQQEEEEEEEGSSAVRPST